MTKKIELTRKELTTILQVATGNVKDFVMDNDKFIDEQLEAINYTHCCKSDSEQLFCGLENINDCEFTERNEHVCKNIR